MAEWDIDLTEVNGLRGWYKKQPRFIRIASAMLLNEFAYGTRNTAVKHIADKMIVRNTRFVETSLRYTKTSTSTPINQQRSYAGSVDRNRFTGWREQEKGTPVKHPRHATIAGRGGSKTKQIRPSVRLKPNNTVIGRADFKTPRGGKDNLGAYLAMMIRTKDTRLFATGDKLFRRNRNKMELVQKLRPKQPKRIPWLRQARAIYFRKNPPHATWARVVGRLMKPPGKIK